MHEVLIFISTAVLECYRMFCYINSPSGQIVNVRWILVTGTHLIHPSLTSMQRKEARQLQKLTLSTCQHLRTHQKLLPTLAASSWAGPPASCALLRIHRINMATDGASLIIYIIHESLSVFMLA